jgi:hypothetical protein
MYLSMYFCVKYGMMCVRVRACVCSSRARNLLVRPGADVRVPPCTLLSVYEASSVCGLKVLVNEAFRAAVRVPPCTPLSHTVLRKKEISLMCACRWGIW